MKKIMVLLLALVLTLAMALPALAATYTPSVEAKDAPEVVTQKDKDGNDCAAIIRDADGKEIASVPFANLVVTPVSQMESTTYANVKARLRAAFNRIKGVSSVRELNSQLESTIKSLYPDVSVDDLVVRDLFDVSVIGDYEEYFKTAGNTLTVRFKLTADSALLLAALDSVDGATWRILDDGSITRNGDYTVEITLDRLGVIAFLYDNGELPAANPSAPKSPQTGVTFPAATACLGAALALAAAALVLGRKRLSSKA